MKYNPKNKVRINVPDFVKISHLLEEEKTYSEVIHDAEVNERKLQKESGIKSSKPKKREEFIPCEKCVNFEGIIPEGKRTHSKKDTWKCKVGIHFCIHTCQAK